MAAPVFPLVNGRRKSFSSIKFMQGTEEERGITNVNFSVQVAREEDRGAGRFKLGDTEGIVTYTSSLTFKFENLVAFCERIAPDGGWMDTMFGMMLVFRESGQSPLIAVDLVGLIMSSNEQDFSEGPLGVTVPCTIGYYLVNGKPPVAGQPL